jgi:uroporphyrinogen-III decarboxylase
MGEPAASGDMISRLDPMAETGVNVISFDYKVNLKKAREILNGKTAVEGNVKTMTSAARFRRKTRVSL